MRVLLRQAIEAYRARTGERLTYAQLAEMTGLSRSTLESLASRSSYNTRLSSIERICRALHCEPGELLALDEPQPRRRDVR
jgi:putative transcriptional regulator